MLHGQQNIKIQLPCKLKQEKSESTSLQNLEGTNGNAKLPQVNARETT